MNNGLLTTIDNPYNPFTNWDAWYEFDARMGYNTPALLGRVAQIGGAIPDNAAANGMADIVRHNVSGVHVMLTADTADELILLNAKEHVERQELKQKDG